MSELDPEEISKAITQFNFVINQVMRPLRLYGQQHYVDVATQEIVDLAWQLHWRLEGVDMPYEIKDLHW